MAKYNNNYNYGNREQRRQQQRQQNNQNQTKKHNVIKMDEHNYRVDVGSAGEEEIYWLTYNDIDYEVDRGWLTFTEVMEIDKAKEERKKRDMLEKSKGLKPTNPYTAADEILDFKKVLKLCFAEGEYERFLENNKRISIDEIYKVSNALVELIAYGKVGAVEDQSKFRNEDK